MKERVLGRQGRGLSLIVAVIGAAFFNLIDGVFGLVQAAVALAAFFVTALLTRSGWPCFWPMVNRSSENP